MSNNDGAGGFGGNNDDAGGFGGNNDDAGGFGGHSDGFGKPGGFGLLSSFWFRFVCKTILLDFLSFSFFFGAL